MALWESGRELWAVARNTEAGRKALGRETLAQQAAREQLEGLMAVVVRRAYQDYRARIGRGKEEVQYRDGAFTVKVRSDYNRDHDCDVTNILIIPRENNPRGSHQHVIIDEDGRELMNEWREK